MRLFFMLLLTAVLCVGCVEEKKQTTKNSEADSSFQPKYRGQKEGDDDVPPIMKMLKKKTAEYEGIDWEKL